MAYAVLADLTALLHLAFIVFVVGGGFLLRRWPMLWSAHLAAAVWGAYVSLANEVCPLTPLEKWFSERAGSAGYPGGFIEHYLMPVIYPEALSPELQRMLGVGVILVNLVAYAWAFGRRHSARRAGGPR